MIILSNLISSAATLDLGWICQTPDIFIINDNCVGVNGVLLESRKKFVPNRVATHHLVVYADPNLFSVPNHRIPNWVQDRYRQLCLIANTQGTLGGGYQRIADQLGVSKPFACRLMRFLVRLKLVVVISQGKPTAGGGTVWRLRRWKVQLVNHAPYKDIQKKTSYKQPAVDGECTDTLPIRSASHGRYVMYHLRKAVNDMNFTKPQKETIITQLATWVWKKAVTIGQVRLIHRWLNNQCSNSVGFTGRSLVRWLCRHLRHVMQWEYRRQQNREIKQQQTLWREAENRSVERFETLSPPQRYSERLMAWATARETIFGELAFVGFSLTYFPTNRPKRWHRHSIDCDHLVNSESIGL